MVSIRPYRSADARAVSRLIRTTMRISNRADYPMERLQPLIDYFSPEKVEALSRERICFVAEEAGEIVGTGALEGGELVTFFVAPQKQGSGIGPLLLGAVEGVAAQRIAATDVPPHSGHCLGECSNRELLSNGVEV